MGKIRLLSILCFFVLESPHAFPLESPQLIYQRIIPGVEYSTTIDPLIAQNGTFSGLLIGTYNPRQILIVDSAGNQLRALNVEVAPRYIFHRYDENGDSLSIYTHGFEPYYIMNYLHILTDSVETRIDTLFEWYDWECLGQDARSRIWQRRDQDGQEIVSFYISELRACYYQTQGWQWDLWSHNSDYSRSMEKIRTRGCTDIAVGNLTGDEELEECRLYDLDWGYEVREPGYSYFVEDKSSSIQIRSSLDSLIFEFSSNDGENYRIWSAPFDELDPRDELIYHGNAQDWLGIHGDSHEFIACYNLASNVMTEQWYTRINNIDFAFDFRARHFEYIYRAGDCIVGMATCSTVAAIDYRNGLLGQPIPLGRRLEATRFFERPGVPELLLVGRVSDTVFIYSFQSPIGVNEDFGTILPNDFDLKQNTPNPFNQSTSIRFSLSSKQQVTLKIYNLLGQRVTELENRILPAGTYSVRWNGIDSDGKPVASGIYLYRLQVDRNFLVRKMVLLK